tara:strand:+ start:1124 stop:1357 length:234 start_codon:yes stop_codon:yes gene_type:complete
MTQQLIAIDADALAALIAKVDGLTEEVRKARIAPEPQWLTVSAYAERIGRSVDTVMRKVRAGELETRHDAGVRMVRV